MTIKKKVTKKSATTKSSINEVEKKTEDNLPKCKNLDHLFLHSYKKGWHCAYCGIPKGE